VEQVDSTGLDTRVNAIDKAVAVQGTTVVSQGERIDTLEKDVKTLTKHVNMVEGSFKVLGVISLCLGIFAGFLKVLTMLKLFTF